MVKDPPAKPIVTVDLTGLDNTGFKGGAIWTVASSLDGKSVVIGQPMNVPYLLFLKSTFIANTDGWSLV